MFTILMLNKNRQKRMKKDESGMVSLLVVSVLAIILALVSIGFSKLMDRELRQSVDRELAAQAFYSAESGLNDARNYLAAGGASFSGCTNWPGMGNSYFTTDMSGSGAAKYSCVSIDSTPNELIYALKAGESVTVKITQNNVGKMYFGWENQSYTGAPQPLGPTGSLPQESGLSPDKTGVLRTAIYPIPQGIPGNANTNDVLGLKARTYFFYPNGGNGAPGVADYNNFAQNGDFIPGNCNPGQPIPTSNPQATPRYCNTIIDNLNGSAKTYYLRLTALYAPLNVSIQMSTNGNNNPLAFDNVQGVVDVTGTGSDVLQRIRARVDLTDQYNAPTYGIQSMVAICKGFRVNMDGPGQYGSAYIDNAIPNSDGACAAPSGGGSVVGSAGDLGPSSSKACPSPYTGSFPNCNYPAPSSVTLTANQYNFVGSGNPTLTWSSTNADNCTGNNFSTGGGSPPSGSAKTGNLGPGSYNFWVTCTGAGGTTSSNTVTITVNNPPPPPPPPNCNNYSANVGMNSASIGGQNPCGIGWSQCNAFNAGGGNISQFWTNSGSYPTFVSYNPPPGTAYVGCMTQQGNWYNS